MGIADSPNRAKSTKLEATFARNPYKDPTMPSVRNPHAELMRSLRASTHHAIQHFVEYCSLIFAKALVELFLNKVLISSQAFP